MRSPLGCSEYVRQLENRRRLEDPSLMLRRPYSQVGGDILLYIQHLQLVGFSPREEFMAAYAHRASQKSFDRAGEQALLELLDAIDEYRCALPDRSRIAHPYATEDALEEIETSDVSLRERVEMLLERHCLLHATDKPFLPSPEEAIAYLEQALNRNVDIYTALKAELEVLRAAKLEEGALGSDGYLQEIPEVRRRIVSALVRHIQDARVRLDSEFQDYQKGFAKVPEMLGSKPDQAPANA